MLVITNVDPATPVGVALKVMQANFRPTLTHICIYTIRDFSVLFGRLIAGISFPVLA